MRRPLSQYPFPQVLLRLLALRLSDPDRTATFDVLHSPFVNWQTFCPDLTTPRPDVWEQVSRQAGIEQGFRERERLVRFFETGVSMPHKRRQGESTIAGEEVRNLWYVLDRLTRLLDVFPEEASWEIFTDRALALMDCVLMSPSSDIVDCGLGTVHWEPGRNIVECELEILDWKSAMKNQTSAIKPPQGDLHNQKSAVKNPQSARVSSGAGVFRRDPGTHGRQRAGSVCRVSRDAHAVPGRTVRVESFATGKRGAGRRCHGGPGACPFVSCL